jgi:hypothetical protein
MDIWYSSWKFGIFSRFGILYEEKSGNPGLKTVFPQFSCGQYIAETPIPSDKGKWTSFDPVGEEIYLRGRTLLEMEAEEGDFKTYKATIL